MNIIPRSLIDVASDLGILGALLVSFGFPFYANVIWSIGNPYLTWYNYKNNQPEQGKLFLAFTIVGLFGVINLWPW